VREIRVRVRVRLRLRIRVMVMVRVRGLDARDKGAQGSGLRRGLEEGVGFRG
jgi:hypothetical protein